MSSPYENRGGGSSRSRHGVLGHWVPLVLTVTVATVGLAAWVWSQHGDEEDEAEHQADLDYENADYGDNPPYGAAAAARDRRPPEAPPSYAGSELRPGETGCGITQAPADDAGSSWGARMSGALRRTPSPQHFFDNAGKTVAAGVAAAGAAMGSALASIREEDKAAFADHETWSEEANAQKDRSPGPSKASGKRRKVVAVVVSADNYVDDTDEDGYLEHASILSHIPRHNDFSSVKLFVLIYAPSLKDQGIEAVANLPPASLSSSFSNIGHDQAMTPNEEAKSPVTNSSSANAAFNAVHSQALSLVEKDTMVLPFTTPNGHEHMLRHINPDVVYLQESLAGGDGSVITRIQTWFRYDVILVVGAESGNGGLADSESEAERPEKAEKWWQRADRVGRGRGVIVVDGMRVQDDWTRRVQGKD